MVTSTVALEIPSIASIVLAASFSRQVSSMSACCALVWAMSDWPFSLWVAQPLRALLAAMPAGISAFAAFGASDLATSTVVPASLRR